MSSLIDNIFFGHKYAVIKKCDPFYALKYFTPLLARCFSKINKCLKYLKELNLPIERGTLVVNKVTQECCRSNKVSKKQRLLDPITCLQVAQ